MLPVMQYRDILVKELGGINITHEVLSVNNQLFLIIDMDNPPLSSSWEELKQFIVNNDMVLLLITDNNYNLGEIIGENIFVAYVEDNFLPHYVIMNIFSDKKLIECTLLDGNIVKVLHITEFTTESMGLYENPEL